MIYFTCELQGFFHQEISVNHINDHIQELVGEFEQI
jgi:hypothetical protein